MTTSTNGVGVHHRACEHCNAAFTSKWVFQRYCTTECRYAAESIRKERFKRVIRTCKICNVEFDATNPNGGMPRTYCTEACRLTGHRRAKREYELRRRAAERASLPPRYCVDCKDRIESRRAKRCPACSHARKLELSRVAAKLAPPPPRKNRKPVRFNVTRAPSASFDVRARGIRLKRAELEGFITVVPSGNPLPVEPRAALIEALDRFPEFRAAFADVHGIKVGSA